MANNLAFMCMYCAGILHNDLGKGGGQEQKEGISRSTDALGLFYFQRESAGVDNRFSNNFRLTVLLFHSAPPFYCPGYYSTDTPHYLHVPSVVPYAGVVALASLLKGVLSTPLNALTR